MNYSSSLKYWLHGKLNTNVILLSLQMALYRDNIPCKEPKNVISIIFIIRRYEYIPFKAQEKETNIRI